MRTALAQEWAVWRGMTKRQTTTNYRKSPQSTTNHREKTKTTTHHRKPPQITTRIWGLGSETRDDAGKPPQTTANHHQNTRKKESNRPFPPTFAIQREGEKLRYWVGFFGILSSPLKTAFGTIGNCRLRSH